MTGSAPGRPFAGVSAILRGRRWSLSRRASGAGLVFELRRGGSSGPRLCTFSLDEPPGEGRALTPGIRLTATPRRGVRFDADGRRALRELQAALSACLESLRGRASPRDPGAALAESHEGQEGSDLLLRTTFACNQRCAFCFVPLTGRPARRESIEAELEVQARRPGRRRELTISGGEPASDRRLPSIIASARRLGFRRFVLQTNGVYLSRGPLLDELVALGARSYLVSFHSHREGAYDRITGSRGQYPRAVAGLTRLLRDARCDVTVNIVVNAENVADLPGTVAFVAGLCAGRLRRRPGVYFSMINEVGHEKARSWAVDLEKAAPFLRRAVALCLEKDLRVARSGGESSVPVCLLRAPARHASRRPLPQERVRYAEDFSGQAGRVGRAKRPGCRRCAYDARCPGVSAQYAALFGLGALRPIRAGRS